MKIGDSFMGNFKRKNSRSNKRWYRRGNYSAKGIWNHATCWGGLKVNVREKIKQDTRKERDDYGM